METVANIETSVLLKLREDYACDRIKLEELEERVWLVLQGQGYLQSAGEDVMLVEIGAVDPRLVHIIER